MKGTMMNSNNPSAFFQRTGTFFKGRMIARIMVSKELWWVRLANGNRHFTVFGLEIEEDKSDNNLRVVTLVILGLAVSVGF